MSHYNNSIFQGNWEDLAYQLDAECAQLIIADPPYYRVKGEFDFGWSSFDEYLIDVENWAKACKHVLAKNGSLFVYGDAKNIAYVQVIFDKYFKLENHIAWHVKDRQTNRQSPSFRSFAPVKEHILFYSNEDTDTGYAQVKLDVDRFTKLRFYFKGVLKVIGKTKTAIIEELGSRVDHCLRWSSSQWLMPTEETYRDLVNTYNLRERMDGCGFMEFDELKEIHQAYVDDYDKEMAQLDERRRFFDNYLKLSDVFVFSQESVTTGKYDHPTVKPEKLTRSIINTTTRLGDLVVVPFVGSGTECAMAVKDGRDFIGFEINPKHIQTANDRILELVSTVQPSLFD